MNNLIWFRNDLRASDNSSLVEAMKGNKVIGFYCFESSFFESDEYGFKRTEKFRAKFLLETVHQLKEELEKLNIPLFVYYGNSANYLPSLIEKHTIDSIFLQREWTRDEKVILDNVKKKVPSGVKFNEVYDQFLYHPDDIPFNDFKSIPDIFTNFRKKCEVNSNIRPIIQVSSKMPVSNLIDTETKIPTLKELGFTNFYIHVNTAFPFKGGEAEAIKRIQNYFWETKKLGFYKKTRNGLIGVDYSSKLSAWLANGSISPRIIYWEVKKFESDIIKNQDTYWLIFELIWRDYFKYVSLKHHDAIFKLGGILNGTYNTKINEKDKHNWINGLTKEPFVNANMKELLETGWMSNRGRQNVASFWSKELNQDWRIGAAYFESMLIDYDVHSNWGNWMYASGVGNDPRNRKFNIKSQAERYDATGKYQRMWLQQSLF
ncbi:deoxyribodipyrimidine photo-lyase (single-stranded DNA-specific) [Maribacter caenipelagi]|uniref:Cryptochrome DASH n=1 Tax=Maribacter caenipelagi TaxID=1447781 RepID=A0A4R7CVA4_9FLAO|nr:DASH family cryptochrome [Maribacter caenipelagi]TDS11571.1 deoxyribodipyrimidine photo-lyase (single-stranded DNA-specific) [Maribacter caenipelagi]